MPSFPLSVALALQVVVVAAAFTAVIVVLSEQQRREFRDSLTARLQLQQHASFEAIVTPLFDRRQTFDHFVDAYLNGHNGDRQFDAPADEPNMTTLERAQKAYDHFYILPHRDPMIRLVLIANRSYKTWQPYEDARKTPQQLEEGVVMPSTGLRRTPRTWYLAQNATWNIWGVDFNKLASCHDERGTACVSLTGYPHVQNPCKPPAIRLIQPVFNSAVGIQPPWEVIDGPLWGTRSVVADQLTQVNHEVLSFHRPEIIDGHLIVFAISFAIPHIKPLIEANVAHPSSRAAVFQQFYRIELGQTEHLMLSGKVDFTDWDDEMVNVTGSKLDGVWEGGQTPDPILNAAYTLVRDDLLNQTAGEVVDMSFGGDRYLVSMVRYVVAETRMNWLYVEYTRRSIFYDESDQTRLAGIMIGMVGGLVVLIVCVLIWIAVRFPLVHLGKNMGLAADLRNEEVVYPSPILSEIADASRAFREMNAKLIAALPFLPQHLRAQFGSSDDDNDLRKLRDDEDGGDDGNPAKHHPSMIDNDDDDGSEGEVDSEMIDYSSSAGTRGTPARRGNVGEGGGRRINNNRRQQPPSSTMDDSDTSRPSNLSSTTNGGDSSQQHHLPAAVATVVINNRRKQQQQHQQQQQQQQGVLVNRYAKDMELRRVGVLVVNVINFHGPLLANTISVSNISASSARAVHSLHATLARMVESCASQERGIIDFFHGDRFVVGFNTARLCGNAARNGAEAAAKLWDRFAASHELCKAFPHGIAMGLGVGRAAVGNHGTDTMQRLATVGPVYTEAVRLQEAMSRRVLLSHRRRAPTTTGGNSRLANSHQPPHPHRSSSSLLNPLIAGRCLVMGRTVQEIETSVVNSTTNNDKLNSTSSASAAAYCQIVGALPASLFLSAVAIPQRDLHVRYARGRNEAVMRLQQQQQQQAPQRKPADDNDNDDKPLNTTTTNNANNNAPSDRSQLLPDSVLVAVIVSRQTASAMMANMNTYSTNDTPLFNHRHGQDNNSSSPTSPTAFAVAPIANNTNTIMNGNSDEWMYQMQGESQRNPFYEANTAMYNLWVHNEMTVTAITEGKEVGEGGANPSVPPSKSLLGAAVGGGGEGKVASDCCFNEVEDDDAVNVINNNSRSSIVPRWTAYVMSAFQQQAPSATTAFVGGAEHPNPPNPSTSLPTHYLQGMDMVRRAIRESLTFYDE